MFVNSFVDSFNTKQKFNLAANCAARDLHGVARATLRLLENSFRAEAFCNLADFFGLVPHDGDDLRGLERPAGTNDVFEQRNSAGAMKHFGLFGTHARSFAGSENDDYSV